MLFKGFQIAEPAVFIDEGILVIIAAVLFGILNRFSRKAYRWNIFHIYLPSFSGICHLFIRFCNIFGIWKLNRIAVDPPEQLIKAGYGSGISPLAKLYPKYHQSGVGVPAAHCPSPA